MSTETEDVAPEEEVVTEEADAVEQSDTEEDIPAEPEDGAEDAPAADRAQASEKPERQPWHVKRLGKVVQERDALKAELEAARAKLADAEINGGASLYTEDEVRQRIATEAARQAHATTLNSKLDDIFAAGLKANGAAFQERVNGYVQAFGPEALATRQDFFEAVADLPNGSDVIFALGGDLDHMAELLEMPAHKMGVELGKLSAQLGSPKARALSRAPAPIRPLETTNVAELDLADPKLPMDEYVRRRQEARAERRNGSRR